MARVSLLSTLLFFFDFPEKKQRLFFEMEKKKISREN